MDRRPFGEELRRSGKLVAPIDLAVPTGNAYYLVTSYRAEGSAAATQFRNWLIRNCTQQFTI
jgi:DNA-binding transcriptional LysR family regulator